MFYQYCINSIFNTVSQAIVLVFLFKISISVILIVPLPTNQITLFVVNLTIIWMQACMYKAYFNGIKRKYSAVIGYNRCNCLVTVVLSAPLKFAHLKVDKSVNFK